MSFSKSAEEKIDKPAENAWNILEFWRKIPREAELE